jgi:hypothetical protein
MLMNRTIINVSLGVAAILLSAAVAAQAATSGGLIIPLYPEGRIASLGVPEIREQLDKTAAP